MIILAVTLFVDCENNPPFAPSTPTGQSQGKINTLYGFAASAADQDGDSVAILFDWGDGSASDWSSFVSGNKSVVMSHSYSTDGTYTVKAKAKNNKGAESEWSDNHSITISITPHDPPAKPSVPSGPSYGGIGISYTFSSSATDPHEDSVAIIFDWGDGGRDTSGYVASGQTVQQSHAWSGQSGVYNYAVKAMALNTRGSISGWSDIHYFTITELPPKWRFQTEGSVNSAPAIGSDGTIYVGSNDNYLYAINPDGSLKWRYGMIYSLKSSPAIGVDGTIYIGSFDGYFFAMNNDGTLKWRFLMSGSITSSPAIGSDGSIYVGSDDYYLYAFNPNGTIKWCYETGGMVESSPAIGSDGTVYVGSDDYYLYAISPDGSFKWRYQTGGSVSSSPAIGSDGTIYVGSNDSYLYAVTPKGVLKWRYLTDGVVTSSPAIDSDGTVYVGSGGGTFYAINSNGTLKWNYLSNPYGQVVSSPAIGSDGIIYIGLVGDLYGINPNGSVRWHCWTTGGWVRSSPGIGQDGTVYVGSDNCFLFAFEGSGRLAGTSWPMFHHDLKHTGRVGGQ